MMLVDQTILRHIKHGLIKITPYNEDRLGSNSYDLTLGNQLLIYTDKVLDAKKDNPFKVEDIKPEGFTLLPGELYLGYTAENTYTHESLVPQLEGKSSIGRLGISIHCTAGFGDAGFNGHWTLEISVIKPVIVYAGMPIAQIFYFQTLGNVINAYSRKKDAKYAEQPAKPVPSAMWRNFSFKR